MLNFAAANQTAKQITDKMKKTFRIIGSMLVAVMMVGTFASCSSDEPGESEEQIEFEKTHDMRLVGKWTSDYDEKVENEDGESYLVKVSETYEFKKDGTFSESFYAVFPDGKEGKSSQKGVWATNDNVLSTTYTESDYKEEIGETDKFTYSFDSNNILSLDGVLFAKK